nr:MAG TPA: Receptor Binding Protein [Caudoviricetes sp.]
MRKKQKLDMTKNMWQTILPDISMALETEKSFPCDAEETETGYDKEYVADDFARYFRAFISSGIFMKEATNLQVIANGDMTVTLKAGKMIIDGYRYDNTGDIIIEIDPADGVLGRIDRVSATWCKDEGDIHYTLQKGTPSYKPVAPECRRTEEYKDYVVADIYVAAGVIKIQQQNITDQRLNSDVCGLAVPFTELNTDALFTQYQDAVNEFLKFADTCIDGTVVGQIEADLKNKLDKTGDSGDNVVAFTQTSSRQNIMTGDTHKTIFGKIKKWFSDMTVAAFAQVITSNEDLMALTRSGYLADALAVKNQFDVINGKLDKLQSVDGITLSVVDSTVQAIRGLHIFKIGQLLFLSFEFYQGTSITSLWEPILNIDGATLKAYSFGTYRNNNDGSIGQIMASDVNKILLIDGNTTLTGWNTMSIIVYIN